MLYVNSSIPGVFCLLFLFGCNSSTSTKNENEVIESPIISVPIVDKDAADAINTTQQEILCDGLARLTLIKAEATKEIDGFFADKTIDSNFMPESRWSSQENDVTLTLTLDKPALIKGFSIAWLNSDSRSYDYDVEVSTDKLEWFPVLSNELSNPASDRAQYKQITYRTASYVRIIPKGNSIDQSNNIVEVEAFGCHSNVVSSIELNDWYLSIPVGNSSKAESIYEQELVDNYFNNQFYFQEPSGGLVFRAPIEGAKTSTNTKYTRTELREMLRRGNSDINTQGINGNNWVFSSASNEEQQAAGGVDGELFVELAVNHVTETGDRSQVGRVIIGQIHANDDEPIRVYYRKLPENDKGAIYLAHEILDGEDSYYELIGTRSKSADNPESGITLNERFAYRISVIGNQLTFTLSRSQQEDISITVDMSNSGYDIGGQYMYFKAGVYNQNNTGDPKDYVQATFYTIENSHSDYIIND